MKLISFLRIIKFGAKNFWRNIWLSLATTLLMTLTLLVVSMLFVLNILGNAALDSIKEKIDISIYFKQDVQEHEINEVKNGLLSLSEVKTIDFVSKEKALDIFREKHKNNPLIISSIEELEENPLQASLIIKARNPEDYAIISNLLDKDRYKKFIDKITFEDNKKAIEKITKITSLIKKVGLGISLIFSLVTIIFMFNTIRLAIYTQKEEIKVMRLVGATNLFIRLPYILEGIFYGILGSIFATTILYFVLNFFSSYITRFIEDQHIDISALLNTRIWYILGLQMIFGILLGMVSSFIAIRRYLRV